jgi:hypothetical protein
MEKARISLLLRRLKLIHTMYGEDYFGLVLLGAIVLAVMAILGLIYQPPISYVANTILVSMTVHGLMRVMFSAFIQIVTKTEFSFYDEFDPKSESSQHIKVVRFVNGWPARAEQWTLPGENAESKLSPTDPKPNEDYLILDCSGRVVHHSIGSKYLEQAAHS